MRVSLIIVCIMTRYGIARFVGSWVSASGYRLRIKKVREDQASVDFLDPRGAPVQRPYMKGAPSMKMIAIPLDSYCRIQLVVKQAHVKVVVPFEIHSPSETAARCGTIAGWRKSTLPHPT